MTKPQLPPELDEKLEAETTAMKRAFREGRADEALAAADAIWDQIPAPQKDWDYYSQIVPLRAAEGAIEAGQLDKAATWLERAYEGYEPLDDPSQQMLDFIKGKLMYRAGEKQVAYAYFDASYKFDGKRAFDDSDPEYWGFYQEAKKSGGVTADAVQAQPVATVVPPVGSGTVVEGAELPDDLHAQVVKLYEEGCNFEDLYASDEAVWCFSQAAQLLPEPRNVWEAATLVYTGLGDALLSMTKYDEAYEALRIAIECPEGTGNGYVWLRLGDAQHALGMEKDALNSWTSAYMLEGKEIFEDEDESWAALLAAGIPVDADR